MIAGDQIMDKNIMIATLDELGKCYLTTNSLKDAEYIFGLLLRTEREQFSDIQTFHQTKFRASVILQELHLCFGNSDAAMKYADLANYHKIAAIDFVKIENICKNFSKEMVVECEEDNDDGSCSSGSGIRVGTCSGNKNCSELECDTFSQGYSLGSSSASSDDNSDSSCDEQDVHPVLSFE